MNRDKIFDLLALPACLLLGLVFRWPGLTVFLTADEARSWYGRSIIFLDSLLQGDFANTAPGGTVPFIEKVSLSPAPGVTTMWTGALGLILENWRQGASGSLTQFLSEVPFDPLDPAMLFSLRLPGVLIAVAAVGLTYWWSRPLLGRWGALLMAGLLALDPFYLALSRVLGHDALVTTFMWLSLLAFLRAVTEFGLVKNKKHSAFITCALRGIHHSSFFILLSGAFAGLAFLSKYPALFIGAFIAIAMLIIYFRQPQNLSPPTSRFIPQRAQAFHVSRFIPQRAQAFHVPPHIRTTLIRWLTHMALWSIAAGLVFVIFWPAMWVNPLGPVTAIINDALRASGSSHQKGSFFLGQPVPDPGLLFYPLVAWLRTTPIVLVGVLLSLWQVVQHLLDRRRDTTQTPTSRFAFLLLTACLWAYILLYTLLVTYGGKKQDRYLLPVFPAITMLATMGYVYVSGFRFHASYPRGHRRITHHASRITYHVSRLKWLFPITLLALQLILVRPYSPYYFSYYNPFAGGGAAAARMVQVGWGEGLDKAAAYLNTLPDAESAKVTAWYSTTFEPYFKGQAIYKIEEEKISRSAKPGLAADYVVFYVNQVQRRLPSEGVLAYFQQSKPMHTVSLDGQDYAWIYPAPGVAHIIGGEARLVGQAELLGYDLVDETGRPVTTAYPESVIFLSLYWEWQGKAEEEPIQISLVDAEGATRGWGNPIQTAAPVPYTQWQEGMIVRDDFALVIFAGTLPGQYRLVAWIDRPSTGETIGVFPLADEVMVQVVPRQTR